MRIYWADTLIAGILKLETIKNIILANPKVIEIHDTHLNCPSSNDKYFSVHIVPDENMSPKDVESVIEELRRRLAHEGVTHLLLQPETNKYANP